MATVDLHKAEEIKKAFREQVEDALIDCNEVDTPYTCRKISTPEGKEIVINYVMNLCGTGNYTIDQALFKYERVFNPRLAD